MVCCCCCCLVARPVMANPLGFDDGIEGSDGTNAEAVEDEEEDEEDEEDDDCEEDAIESAESDDETAWPSATNAATFIIRGDKRTRGEAPTVAAPTDAEPAPFATVPLPVAIPVPVLVAVIDPPALPVMRRPEAGGDGPVRPPAAVARPSEPTDGRRALVCGEPRLPALPPATPI